MSDIGGLEFGTPSEGLGSAPEELSEDAKQRFAAAAAAMQAIRREEKRSKKRDSRVAKTIIQFLNDDRYTHLFVLISRLVARDCPSIFILSILSLIDDDCLSVVEEYLKEASSEVNSEAVTDDMQLMKTNELNAETNQSLIKWITRMQMVLSQDAAQILEKLMIDDRNIDGTVLQLTTFVLQEFFRQPKGGGREIPFEQLHPLTASILQSVFEPFSHHLTRNIISESAQKDEDDD